MKTLPIPTKNLVLLGGRGCGKSSISRRILRKNKHFSLFSLDDLIRYEAAGATIPEIVAQQGWRGFRELEYQVVRKASTFPAGALIDCGGGVVVDLDAQGREYFSERKVLALREHAEVIYLQRDVEYLLARIADDANRPSLSDSESFVDIMQRRDAWYRQAAHRVIACDRRPKRELVNEVLDGFFATGERSPGCRARPTRALC